MKKLLLHFACLALSFGVYGQGFNRPTARSRNYKLLTLLERNAAVSDLLASDTVLMHLGESEARRVREALQSRQLPAIMEALRFSAAEKALIRKRLSLLYDGSPGVQQLVSSKLIPSGCYGLFSRQSRKEQFLDAIGQDLAGIDWTIGVYGEGKAPHYPDIDSISFNVHDRHYIDTVKKIVGEALKSAGENRLFFELPIDAAMAFLRANGRMDAGYYEPMSGTVNKAALSRIARTDWAGYPYTVLLVPGEGPERDGEAISPGSKLRCRLAVDAYHEKLAPFILVSGGKVHPYKTKYCEAEEMKRYLVDSLQVPETAIIMEPHARHTTTNMRNGVRLMIEYGIPIGRPAVVVCEKDDEDYITGMDGRCKKELGYVPYRLGKRISATELEFYGDPTSLTIDPTEPMDP